jgi:hypothetical protein
MTKETAKDIAITLIAMNSRELDGCAFEECDITDNEIGKILYEINHYCQNMINKIERKYEINLQHLGRTSEILDNILYE